ncbi:MAG TPA: HipA domain-containing protein [Pseudolysinimonas sp.]|nr:HipA domain-containing protein [Pseudolysinimonas sp.]
MTDIDPVDVDVADVFKGSRRAGTLRRDRDDVVFEYDRDYLTTAEPGVATTLPKRVAEYRERGGAVPPYFAGLLPEGRRLTAIQAALKTSPDDEFSQVVAVGADCVGDVRVLAHGASASEPSAARVHQLPDPEEISFRDLFADLLQRPLDEAAIAGVQDKISDQMISLPVSGSLGPAIIKLAPPAYPRLVENEAFFLDVARACGLEAASAQVIHDRDGEAALVVERFDRIRIAGRTVSIAQEDAVQLAGRWPAAKYLMSSREVFSAVARVSSAPVVEISKLVRLFAMSYIIGNGGLHAKNVSVHNTDGLWRVTPAYDVVTTLPYGDRTTALETEGRRDNLRASDFIALAARHDVSEAVTRRLLREVATACRDLIRHAGDIGFDQKTTEDLIRTVDKRADDLNR